MIATIDLSPAILEAALRKAQEQEITLDMVIAEALRTYLAEPTKLEFKLSDGSSGGGGWAPDVDPQDRDAFLERLYARINP